MENSTVTESKPLDPKLDNAAVEGEQPVVEATPSPALEGTESSAENPAIFVDSPPPPSGDLVVPSKSLTPDDGAVATQSPDSVTPPAVPPADPPAV
jgi:hypothetical protein